MRCSFCGSEMEKGTGKIYSARDGSLSFFCSSKCEKNKLKLKRKPQKVLWTDRFIHEKGIRMGGVKKKVVREKVEKVKKAKTTTKKERRVIRKQKKLDLKKEKELRRKGKGGAPEGEDEAEVTFAIIKPDAVKEEQAEDIIKLLKEKGFKVVEQKQMQLSEGEAKELYEVHKEKPFYGELVTYITSGPVVALVLEGKDPISHLRKVMGATDPAKAEDGTVRKKYGKDIQSNAIHGSDSEESLKKELPIFFQRKKLLARIGIKEE